MPTILELIKAKNNRLDTVPEEFSATVLKSQKKIYQEILSLMNTLERDGDRILITKSNLEIVSRITDDLRQILNESEYAEAVTEFAREFNSQQVINEKYFNKAFPDFEKSAIGTQVVANARTNAIELLIGSPIDTEFMLPIRSTLDQAVASGASFKSTLETIREIAEGSEGSDGKLLAYSKTIAKTSFATGDRAYTNVVSDELGVEWFFYSGGLVDSSRPFCIARDGQYFHFLEIESWVTTKSGEGNPTPHKTWAGMIEGTNEQTIFVLAGGWNCNHSIMPVGISFVPKDVIERNIENGNYEPTEAEEAELGL